MFNIQTYRKDGIKIDFVAIVQDNALEIVIVLPIGNILELN